MKAVCLKNKFLKNDDFFKNDKAKTNNIHVFT